MKQVRTNTQSKVALVTGASSGIGSAVTRYLIKKNYLVIILARDTNRINKTIHGLDEKGLKSYDFIPTDLASTDSVNQTISLVLSRYSQIDLVVHAASIYHNDQKAFFNIPYTKYSHQDILNTLNVTLTSLMLLTNGLTPTFTGKTQIITISGTFESGAKGWLPYYVAKKGLEDFTVGLAQELTDQGIKVNCISPSDTLTDSYKKFFPQYANPATTIKPADIVDTVSFLISPKAKYINGQIIAIKNDHVL